MDTSACVEMQAGTGTKQGPYDIHPMDMQMHVRTPLDGAMMRTVSPNIPEVHGCQTTERFLAE